MTNNSEVVIGEKKFMQIMRIWSAFSANDINNDNELDINELEMMWWLLDGKRPEPVRLQREIEIMDEDKNGTIDRIEWMSYLCAPPQSGSNSLGSKDEFDFELRELYEKADADKDGTITISEFTQFIKNDM